MTTARCMTGDRPTILCVDDSPDNLSLLNSLLREKYRVKIATSGAKALQIAKAEPLDLILLDVVMEGIDGHEVCRRLKDDLDTAAIPVIFLTSRTDVEDERIGLELGAVDYIAKPISPPVLHLRVSNHLTLAQARKFLEDHNEFLQQEVKRRTEELLLVQDTTITALAALAETRDNETGRHIIRTQNYVRLLAERLREVPGYEERLSPEIIQLMYKSAPLHDIGKVGIPDAVLLKPGKLTAEEFEIIKSHPDLGRKTLEAAERQLGSPSSFLRFAREVAHCHHEKWDGSGYPRGLKGEDIPLSARIMAIADVYDALISVRPYKRAFSREQAEQLIKDGRGTHFDPAVVDIFLANTDAIYAIAQQIGVDDSHN